jgi:low affinity Fe/Cu permease
MLARHLESNTHRVAKWCGSSTGFLTALLSIGLWIIVGKLNAFSYNWENGLMIYIGTITFLMIFIIQRSTNKELLALHVKLNELIITSQSADNRMMVVEQLSEKEISDVQAVHTKIASDEKEDLVNSAKNMVK